MPRRHFLTSLSAAGLAGSALALTASPHTAEAAQTIPDPALAAPAAGGALPYPTLRRPFAMPGVKEQEWTGALFVGDGESRFALRVGLLTETGKATSEKRTNTVWGIGPMAPDGAYKQVQVSTDDRLIMPAHLDALREVIANP